QHTTSDLLFKNALYDRSRTIFSGLIQVQPGAHHTDSYQSCRNLLGSDEAEANAMPGLEIDADQVKCSHGSTSGTISDDEIFYLRARGIPADAARRMISLGFLNEAIARLEGEEIRRSLFDRVERKFAGLA
ncbi:MAG TPA: SufD family Fe-S cluster assembly protein, partial [Bacteroidia bacterium]|nr:SufD family Fe-S cluster assembly protein [Bacteroidia bacterium]